jgi:hypothetical protein
MGQEYQNSSPEDNDNRVVIKPRAPRDTAETFYDRRVWMAGKSMIRYRNTWYVWTGTNYRKRDAEAVRSELWSFMAEGVVREKEAFIEKDADGQEQTVERLVKRRFRPEPNDISKLYDALMHYEPLRVPDEL